MLKIRLTRRGKRSKAFFWLVVAEHTSPIKGRFLEALGFLNPHTKEKNIKFDRVKHWLEKGAQCSDTAHNLLVSEGIVKGPKRAVKMRKKEDVAEKAEDKPEEKKKAVEEKEEVKTEKSREAKKEAEPDKKTEKEAKENNKEVD